MATLTIANVSSSDFFLNDIYATIAAGDSIQVTRSPAEISSMVGLQTAVADAVLTASVAFSADELASGIGLPIVSESVSAGSIAPVLSTVPASPLITIYKALDSGGASGTPDDVVIYAVNNLPYKIRILSAEARISTAVASSTLNVRSTTGGGGTLAAGPIDSGTAGIASATGPNATVVLTPGASVGLFVRRSDRSVVGQIIITARIED